MITAGEERGRPGAGSPAQRPPAAGRSERDPLDQDGDAQAARPSPAGRRGEDDRGERQRDRPRVVVPAGEVRRAGSSQRAPPRRRGRARDGGQEDAGEHSQPRRAPCRSTRPRPPRSRRPGRRLGEERERRAVDRRRVAPGRTRRLVSRVVGELLRRVDVGLPSCTAAIRPYSQYVHASVEMSSARSGTSWITAAARTAGNDGAARRTRASAAR